MSKKSTILLSALALLLASILGSLVPAVHAIEYDGRFGAGEYYTFQDLLPIRNQYVGEVNSTCGPYAATSSFQQCYLRIMNSYSSTYGGLANISFIMGYSENSTVVTGFNLTAETLRFYVDETNAFRAAPFEYENLYIFWLDGTAEVDISKSDSDAKDYIEPLLRGEIPTGVHLLYGSQRGATDWLSTGVENRVEFADTGNFAEDSQLQRILMLGYDTDGTLRFRRSSLTQCLAAGLDPEGECQATYYYDTAASTYNFYYAGAPARQEDLARLNQKKLESAAREAEAAARAAEEAARRAEQAAREAEQSARDAEEKAKETESKSKAAETAAREAETKAKEAERAAREAEAKAEQAEASAKSAESSAKEAESEARKALDEATAAIEQSTAAARDAAAASSAAADAVARAEATASAANSAAEQALAAQAATKDAFANLEQLLATIQQETASLTSQLRSAEFTLASGNSQPEPTSAAPDCPSEPETPPTPVETPTTSTEPSDTKSDFPYWILTLILVIIFILAWFFAPHRRQNDQNPKKS